MFVALQIPEFGKHLVYDICILEAARGAHEKHMINEWIVTQAMMVLIMM